MKKGVLKNLISIGISSLLLLVFILIALTTNLFNFVNNIQQKISLSGQVFVKIILALAITVLASNVFLLILRIFRNKKGRTGTLATVLYSLIKYVAVIIAFCWILSIIGVNISTIFASIGILTLILGFGAESLVADLVTGVFILFENQYNVGDIIEIDGFRGTVSEIGIRTLSLKDSGGNIKIINNSDLKNIINRSNLRSVAVCDIGISYDVDLEKLDETLNKILADIKSKHEIFKDKIECAGVESLSSSSVVIRIVADVDESDVFKGKRILNKELKIAFDKEKIKMPYTQIEVHNK